MALKSLLRIEKLSETEITKLRQRLFPIHLLLIALVLSSTAQAVGLDSGDVLNRILGSFSTVAVIWEDEITERASWLFWEQASISMVCTYGFTLRIENALSYRYNCAGAAH